jgi:hypothetical protein
MVHFLSHKESVFPIRKDQSVGAAWEGGDPVYCEKHTQHINTAEQINEMQFLNVTLHGKYSNHRAFKR